jgi:hypothetical protein
VSESTPPHSSHPRRLKPFPTDSVGLIRRRGWCGGSYLLTEKGMALLSTHFPERLGIVKTDWRFILQLQDSFATLICECSYDWQLAWPSFAPFSPALKPVPAEMIKVRNTLSAKQG